MGAPKPSDQLLSKCCSSRSYKSEEKFFLHDNWFGADTSLPVIMSAHAGQCPVVMRNRSTLIPQCFLWDSVLFLEAHHE